MDRSSHVKCGRKAQKHFHAFMLKKIPVHIRIEGCLDHIFQGVEVVDISPHNIKARDDLYHSILVPIKMLMKPMNSYYF